MTSDHMTIYERWNQFMRLLSAQPRRQIIVSLMEASETAWLSLPGAATTSELSVDIEQLELKLRQIHLPEMADAGYVEWRPDPFEVARGPRFDEPAAVMHVLLTSDGELPQSLCSDCVEESAEGVRSD